uniref:Uncharacterized protein n=1 Tax=Arundo donax TaxID=35708 RepID=A0A0A9H728_ARUDO
MVSRGRLVRSEA